MLKKTALVFMGFLTGLLLSEGLCRLILPFPKQQIALLRMRAPDLQLDAETNLKHPGFNPFLQRRPSSSWICDGQNSEIMNNEGFRDRDFVNQSETHTFRIATIGDSFTEGWMGPRNTAFPRIMERALNTPTLPQVEVYNFALANRSPIRYLALYDEVIRKYHPQLMIVCLYRNDLAEDEALRPYVKFDARGVPSQFDFARYFRHTPRMPQTKWERRRDRWQWVLCQHSRLFPYLATYLTVDPEFRRRTLNPPPPSAADTLWKITGDYLHTLADLIENDGARLVLAYIPDQNDFTLKDPLYELSANFCEESHLPFFHGTSFWNTPDPSTLYLPNDGHFSVEGNRVYGEDFAQFLSSQSLIHL